MSDDIPLDSGACTYDDAADAADVHFVNVVADGAVKRNEEKGGPHLNFETYTVPTGPGIRGGPSDNVHLGLPEEPRG